MYTLFDNKLFGDCFALSVSLLEEDGLFYFDRDGADLTLHIYAYEIL